MLLHFPGFHPPLPCCPQDRASADKERVAKEVAAMDPALVAAAKEAVAAKRKEKKDKKEVSRGC